MKINIEFELEFLKEMLKGILEAEYVCWGEGIGPDLTPYVEKLVTAIKKQCPIYIDELLNRYRYMYTEEQFAQISGETLNSHPADL